ncbi:MAG: hypothetical protein NTU88_08380 [Armatimonadetes bacterium]|nr:hypothetical protein [Armatimonadota bacterium]
MNAPTQENAELPVLLGYRMPVWKQLLLIALALIIGVAAKLAYDPNSCGVYRLSVIVLLFSAIALLVWFTKHTVRGFECLSPGMNVEDLSGRVMGIPWDEVRRFRRLSAPFAVLSLRKGWYIFLGLPRPVLDQLISILREASNAQIIGFE